jgi:hypothetical protein
MLVLQQTKVLPVGAKFKIIDENRVEVIGKIASDHSIIFDTTSTADRYYKIYSNFRVLELNVDLSEHKDVWGEAIDVSFIIKVR